MWRKLKNILLSFKTYGDLSPDLNMRRQVNRSLQNRPALPLNQWFENFWQPLGISKELTTFVYAHLTTYSGLKTARIRPGDRLTEDLHWELVCWFDWQLSLCDDFYKSFGIDISDQLDDYTQGTLQDLVIFLNLQLLVNSQ